VTDLFFSNGQHNARYLTFFAVFIANIATSHPGATELFKRGAISVASSFISGNHCAVDKTMEETCIKHSRSHGGAGGNSAGLSGILTNHDSYQRWVRTAHEKSKFISMTFNMADMLSNPGEAGRNRVLRSSEI